MENDNVSKNIPTIIIVLGATGDLMKRKIVPALFNLYEIGRLPKLFHFIGFSRRPLSDDDFRKYVTEILTEDSANQNKQEQIKTFVATFSYHVGQLENIEDYNTLSKIVGKNDEEWKTCSNKLFYLAVPPPMYEPILNNLSKSGLTIPCSPEEGWTRVLIEKPFGKDLKTSEDLDKLLSSLFKENQIYRIDHYLGKEMVQNILRFRFSNNLFEDSWHNRSIEKVEIKFLESIGVEGRGKFYDGTGAFRDVGQNHVLQMLALIAMDNTGSFLAEDVRKSRAKALELLMQYSADEVKKYSFRAQYEGYKSIENVGPDSVTETYFKIRASLKGDRWSGVPFILEGGKRMGATQKEIIVTFKHPEPCFCREGEHFENTIIFRMEPEEEIIVKLYTKKPGLENDVEERDVRFFYKGEDPEKHFVESYEKLLYDAILGDQTLFASTEEVRAMWKFTDPIISAWGENLVPLKTYDPDSNDMGEESFYVSDYDNQKLMKQKNIGVVGLGRMGSGIALQLAEKGWNVVAYNRTESVTKSFERERLKGAYTFESFVKSLDTPRVIWLMVSAGAPTDDTINGLLPYLSPNDLIIDGGNSFYKDSLRRNELLTAKGIKFMDIGVSGGPDGARNGACLMVGGERSDYEAVEPLIKAISSPLAYGYFGKAGAGHFAKMVHNGIEYGMMESIAEGTAVLKTNPFNLDLAEIFRVYNNRSVIESRLVQWTEEILLEDPNLTKISSFVGMLGEGEWTVDTAHELKVAVPIIEGSVKVRQESDKVDEHSPEGFRNKVISALRGKFGHHKVEKDS